MNSNSAARKRNVFDVIDHLEGKSRTILVRVDFNVPMTSGGEISDDARIQGALPTIMAITSAGCNAVLVSHMGRPKLVQAGSKDEATRKQREELSLRPVVDKLESLLGKRVIFGEDCLGEPAEKAIAELPKEGGGIVLLENLRFYKAEEKNGKSFCSALASYADAYINDAFGTSHRAHASVAGVPALLDKELCGVGCLVASELSYLDFKSLPSKEDVAAVIGGSKVSTKLPIIKQLMEQVQTLVLGGGLAFTFLKAQGVAIGDSLVEEGMIDTARQLMEDAASKGKRLILPVDAVCVRQFPSTAIDRSETRTFDLVVDLGIEDGWMGLDVGPKSVDLFRSSLDSATRIVMNGPMGVFEIVPFDDGTRGLVDILVDRTQAGSVTVVGGGDSAAAVKAFGMTNEVSYVSTGGGATLELLAGATLPGVAAIAEI